MINEKKKDQIINISNSNIKSNTRRRTRKINTTNETKKTTEVGSEKTITPKDKINAAGLYSQIQIPKKTNKNAKSNRKSNTRIAKNSKTITQSTTKKSTNRTSKNEKTNTSTKTSTRTNTKSNTKQTKIRKKSTRTQKPSLKVTFLGGLNEIGKNMTMFECGNDAFILDCGLAFPEDDMMGIDAVIPDFSFVERYKDKIKGIVFTHGHEDHIGGVPYLMRKCQFPLYGTALTLGVIASKLKERRLLDKSLLHIKKAGETIKFGCMEVELIHVNHSIPDAVGIAIHSPAGTIVHTGDFKIDFTPAKDRPTDLARFAELGKEGVLALFSDSTNSENEGYTATEKTVEDALQALFNKAEGKRIIVASFASNINRIQQIIQCAYRVQRKVAFSGRSMLNYMDIAAKLGYLDIPKDVIIDLDKINKYRKEDVVLVTTGSQGEPMSALSRMANSDHRTVSVGPNDFIILSSRPIPGNEKTVGRVVNELLKKGCDVVYESAYDVHVSGHACAQEQKMIMSLVKPKYFIPVHGEQKHMQKQKATAMSLGIPEENIFIENIGSVLELNQNFANNLAPVPAGAVMVDGSGVGDVGSIVLRDRKILGESGLIIVVATINKKTGNVVSGPDIISRGFVYVKESEPLMIDARNKTKKVIEACQEANIKEWSTIKNSIKDELSKMFYSRTKRNPMILPILMEI